MMLSRIDYMVSLIGAIIGGTFSYLYGDIDTVLVCLFGTIILDYISGVIVACYEKKLSSSVGFKGILKKLWILLVVGLAGLLDKSLNLDIARNMICCFYISNEAISIVENGSKLGIPFPKKVLKFIEEAKNKTDKEV